MITKITAKDNKKIKETVKLLSSSKHRKQSGLFVLEGVRLCTDAANSGIEIKTLFFTESANEHYDESVSLLTEKADEAYLVTNDVFTKISDTVSPQGVIAVCVMPDIESARDSILSDGRYIACENVSDPSNLGAISRTAEALGVSGMILIGNCCDPFGPKAQRASMGSMLRLDLFHFDDIDSLHELSQSKGITLFASVVDKDAEKLDEIGFKNGDVIIIGNEGNGLSPRAKEICDRRVTIPITGRAESFNAASAAAILMWELMK